MIDIDQIRADTPAASRLAYLHNAGAALMPATVVAAMKQHIDLESEIGGYAAADRESDRLDAVYGSVARLLNAAPDEIALMENATVAWQMAFYALPFRKGDRILTAEAEYAANYVAFLQVAKRTGAVIDIVPSDASGELDVDALERMIDERVKLIAITWVPTNGGLVNPAAADRQDRAGARHSLSARRLPGGRPDGRSMSKPSAVTCCPPRGANSCAARAAPAFSTSAGALLQQLEPPMIDHFAAPWVSRDTISSATTPAASRPGRTITRPGSGWARPSTMPLRSASARSSSAAVCLRAAFAAASPSIRGVTIRDLGRAPGAIVSFTMEGHEAEAIVRSAAAAGITIGASDPSSTRIDAEIRSLPPVVRASPHYYNTEAEIDRLIGHLAGLAPQ